MANTPLATYFTTTANCTSVSEQCPVIATVYGYYPNLAANVSFCIWFAVFTVAQLTFGFRYRSWIFTRFVAFGTISEMIGYIGRILLHANPWSNVGFEIQICTLIFAPSFFAAAIYMTLKHMVRAVGPQFSPIRASLYPWLFISFDFLSLLLQAIGGGIAASATTPSGTAAGGHIMLAGIVFQVATFTFLYGLMATFLVNFRRRRDTLTDDAKRIVSSRDFVVFAVGIFVASVAIYVRCVFRIADLANGWANPIMRNEDEFIVLDGVMCCIASLALTVCHPGIWFKAMSQKPVVIAEKSQGSISDSEA